MRRALAEGRKGLGRTSPNPAVGAVLVARGRLIAVGYHRRAGEPHAEVECLQNLSSQEVKAATLYVTLEPCSTCGRTGPCTAAIITAGIKRVVIGTIDLNPVHNGRGVEILRRAGIEVSVGVLENECRDLNEAFNKWIQTRQPFVIAKCGMSLDGKLTRGPNESQWITSAHARRHALGLREVADAIIVGAETVRADNPRLTTRLSKNTRQPWRVVLTRSWRLPKSAKIFTDRFAERTLIFRNQPLREVLRRLGEKSVTSVIIEGGGQVLGEALDERLIDKVQIYFGAMCAGGPVTAFGGRGASSTADAPQLARIRYQKIGHEICLTGYPIYPTAIGE